MLEIFGIYWQLASAFNQPLSFDVSSVTNVESCPNELCMFNMFGVRSAQYPVRIPQSRPAPLHELLCTAATPQTPSQLLARTCSQPTVEPSPERCVPRRRTRHLPRPLWSAPHPAPYALLSTRQEANSLSNTNKLLIRCAWAGTTAFASAGYGSSWGPGTCPATFTTKASLVTAVQEFNANPTAARATYGPIAGWGVSAITNISGLFKDLKNFDADISSWDTSSVTNMGDMFNGASVFNQPLSFDTSNVTSMLRMFPVRSSPCPVPNLQSSPPLHAAFAGVALHVPRRGSAVRVGVQPGAELRHVRRQGHERHV